MTPPIAKVIYAWGTNEFVADPGWSQLQARFEGDELKFEFNEYRGPWLMFRMNNDGTLSGTYRTNVSRALITMERVDDVRK
jgi:hypothetical protein